MSRRTIILISALAVVSALAAGAWFGARAWVAARIVAQAGARGFDVTLDAVELGTTEIVARNVEVRAAAMPGLVIRAAHARITLSAFQPVAIALEGAHATLTGPIGATTAAAGALSAQAASGGDGADSALTSASVEGDLIWSAIAGDATALRCAHAKIELKSAKLSDVSASCDGLQLTRGALALGPWSADLLRDASGERVRLVLEPGASAPAAVNFTRAASGATHFDAALSKKRPSDIGLSPEARALLGLSSNAPVDLAVRYDESAAGAPAGKRPAVVTGSFEIASDQLPVGPGKAAAVHLALDFKGAPGGPFAVTGRVAEIGGFSGVLNGQLTPEPPRAQLTFDTQVVSCADAARKVAADALGDLGKALGTFASALGGAQALRGSVSLHADITADLRADPPFRITTHTTGDCDLSLFR
jgi:hypothetical protein